MGATHTWEPLQPPKPLSCIPSPGKGSCPRGKTLLGLGNVDGMWASLLTCCVTLGRSLTLSEPLLLVCKLRIVCTQGCTLSLSFEGLFLQKETSVCPHLTEVMLLCVP